MDCSVITSKTILLFLSLIFWAAGGALIYVGSYVLSSYRNFSDFRVDQFALIPAVIIIGVAIVMFIIGFVGCCATLRESKMGLGFFFVIIFLIFAAEVAAFVCGCFYKGRIKGSLDQSMSDVFQKYDGNSSKTRAVNYLQSQLECCGINNYTDWTNMPWFQSHNSVPVSCCKTNTTGCTGQLNQTNLLNTQGCEVKLESLLQDVLSYATLIILGFVLIKFFGMLSVCIIACRSSRNDYEPLYA